MAAQNNKASPSVEKKIPEIGIFFPPGSYERLSSFLAPATPLFPALSELLQAHFSPDVAARILDDFKARVTKEVQSLSLDDIERLAVELAQAH